jgi:hypothetical protein
MRSVRSIQDECLDRITPMGEHHFRRAVAEYVEHDHRERHHQGLDNRLIADPSTTDNQIDTVPDGRQRFSRRGAGSECPASAR